MAHVSKHFRRSEFACPCCGWDVVDVELLRVLEDIRRHFNAPVKINSGCRCESHNKAVGGSKHSQHVKGKAADIVVDGVRPEKVTFYLGRKYENNYGIGWYVSWTHIDVRPEKARWDNRP